MMNKVFGWRGAGFVVTWVGLISLTMKLAAMQGEELFTFNPYRILGIEEGATPKEIKSAQALGNSEAAPVANVEAGATKRESVVVCVDRSGSMRSGTALRGTKREEAALAGFTKKISQH